ncbi:MAG: hypothetical protein C0623_13370 [Desulfuromonas sp.]|nr:MAG: hypothetical protein C0623_13370 [Desulfuromonas sp.]
MLAVTLAEHWFLIWHRVELQLSRFAKAKKRKTIRTLLREVKMAYMKNLVIFVSLMLLLSPLARAATVREVVETLEVPFRVDTPSADAIHDVETEFSQESGIASLDRKQQGSGRVTLQFDRQSTSTVPLVKFRWEYDFPTRQEIVSDGRTMWVYIPENNQVIESDVSRVSQARSQDPLTFLTGLGNLSRDFLVRWASPNRDDDGNYVLKLTPKTTTTMFRELEVVVDRRAVNEYAGSGLTGRTFPIVSTRAVDTSENTTKIVFDQNRVRLNRGVSPLNFDFMMPAGVDVVRPEGHRMGY